MTIFLTILIIVVLYLLLRKFLNKRPSSEQQAEYTKIATGIMQNFIYATTKGHFAPRDGETKIFPIKDKDSRNIIKNEILKIIQNHHLKDLDLEGLSKWQESEAHNAIKKETKEDIAFLVFTCILSYNMMARHYYEQFPSYNPMFKMINTLAKTCMPVIDNLFEGNISNDIKQIAPYFAKSFKEYKSFDYYIPNELQEISQKLGKDLDLESENLIEDMFRNSEESEIALRELLDYCKKQTKTKEILKEFKISDSDFNETYKLLCRSGASQWAAGHYIPASSLAYPDSLKYVILNKNKVEHSTLSFNLIMYFEEGLELKYFSS